MNVVSTMLIGLQKVTDRSKQSSSGCVPASAGARWARLIA